MEDVFKYIDTNQQMFIDRLRDAVAIRSVSGWPEVRGEVTQMVQFAAKMIETLGGTTRLAELGTQTLEDGTQLPLPPVLLGHIGQDPHKKTVLIYGHLDVQPAKKDDGWDTEPFVLTEKDGKLFGRGASDDKVGALAVKVLQ